MIGTGGGVEEASRARVCMRQVKRIIANSNIKRRIFKGKGETVQCMCPVCLTYGSKTWAMKVMNMQRLERTEKMMIRWMCGVTLKDRKPSEELIKRLGIERVCDRVRQGD